MGIFFEHDPPSLLQTDNGAEFSNKTLMARIKEPWTSTRIVHCRSRHPEDHGSLERANMDFKLMLYARLKDMKKEYNQWVCELPFIQYCKNNAHHSGIRGTPYCVHFGRAPADLSEDLTLARGYASFDPSSNTPLPSPNPLPFSHLSLLEPASGSEVDISSFPYDEVPESEYASSIVLSSQQPPLKEPSVLSTLMPTSSIPVDTNDTSYDMSVSPQIGRTITPYFDLATGISHQIVPTLSSVRLLIGASDSSPADEAYDFQYEEELQCTSCPDICLAAGCMALC